MRSRCTDCALIGSEARQISACHHFLCYHGAGLRLHSLVDEDCPSRFRAVLRVQRHYTALPSLTSRQAIEAEDKPFDPLYFIRLSDLALTCEASQDRPNLRHKETYGK